MKEVIKKIREQYHRGIVERIKHNAYADAGSTNSTKDANLYNVRVSEAVFDDDNYTDIEEKFEIYKDSNNLYRMKKREEVE